MLNRARRGPSVPFILALAVVPVLAGLASCRSAGLSAYFSPGGGATEALVRVIDGARSEVLVAIYAFTLPAVEEALVRAVRRRVDVRVIFDRDNSADPRSAWRRLARSGVEVRFSTAEGNLHHKYAVVDRRHVVTGSFNWIRRAEDLNHENLLVVDSHVLAAAYRSDWERLPCDDAPPDGR